MDLQRATAARRSQSYWLLSRLFLEQPEQPMLEELAKALKAGHGADPTVANDLRLLQEAVEAALASPSARTDLQVEYTRLLSGTSKASGAPEPYESMSVEGRLFGESTEAVSAAYVDAGHPDPAPEAGPPDHIGTEVRFMSILCYHEMEAWREGNESDADELLERELDFLDAHVMLWVPAFCDRLAELTTHSFYLAVAKLTAAACRQDRDEVAAFVHERA